MLFPVPFAPELVFVRARRIAWPSVRVAAKARSLRLAFPVVAVSALVIAAFAQLHRAPGSGRARGLVVLALVAGLELRVDARGPVSPMVATLVIAAVVVGGHAALGGAVLVAALATGTAWIVQGSGWWAPLLAAGAATASAVVFDARPSRAGALAAALVFELVVVTRMRRIVWTMPLVCRRSRSPTDGTRSARRERWCSARARSPSPPRPRRGAHHHGRVVCSGSTPPATRPARIEPSCAAPRPCPSRSAIAAVDRVADRAVLIPLAEAAGAGVTAMAMVGVRQWRFAPRRRAVDAVLLLGCSLAILLVYPPVAATGDAWSVAILGGALAVSAGVAWPVARRADAAARTPVAPDTADVVVR